MGDGAEQSPNEQKKKRRISLCRVVRMIYFLFYSDYFCADTKAFIPMADGHTAYTWKYEQQANDKQEECVWAAAEKK